MKKNRRNYKISRFLSIVSVIILIFMSIPVYLWLRHPGRTAYATWYNNSWSYRKELTVDPTKVSGSSDLTDFPVLVSITDTDLISKAQTDGDDILFTDSAGTKLDHEIESYNSSTGALVAWVQVTTLYTSSDTTLYMYYGNASATSQQNVEGVWTSNYKMVQHLKETSGTHYDSTSNNSDSTSVTVTTQGSAAGQINGSDDFDGSNDVVNITESSALRLTSAGAISMWIKPDTTNQDTYAGLFAKSSGGDAGTISYSFFWDDDGGILLAYICNGTSCNSASIAEPGDTNWHHIVFRWNGTKLRVYKDATGGIEQNQTVNAQSSSSHSVKLGGDTYGADSGTDDYFDGKIDEVRVSNTSPSDDWITTEYNNQSAPSTFFSAIGDEEVPPATPTPTATPTPIIGLVSKWRLDDASGSTAQDTEIANNDGSVSGAAWKPESECVYDGCLFFDGSDDVVTVTNADSIDLNVGLAADFTIEGWVRVNSDGEGNTGQIIWKGDNTYLRVSNDGGGAANLDASLALGTANATVTITDGLTLNRWHHVAMGYTDDSDDEISVYIDGVLKGTSTNGNGSPAADTNNLLLGGSTSSNFHGFIDEMAVYNTQRTTAEITIDFNRGAAVFGKNYGRLSNGLVGYWKMDEASGNANDSSGNGNTLTNTNSVSYTSGKFGNAGDFEKDSSQYQYVADNANLSTTGDLSVGGWIKPESVTADIQFNIAGKWDGANESYLLAQFGDEIRFYVDSSSNYVTTTASNLTTATWYHVLGIYSASSRTAKIYINGVEQTTTTTGTIPASIGDDGGRFGIGAEDSTVDNGTIDIQVGSSSDDAFWRESDSTFNNTATVGYFGYSTNAIWHQINSLQRFTNITIPQAATITSSYLSFYAGTGTGTDVNASISAIDSDNAAAPTTYSTAENATRTTGVSWLSIPTWTLTTWNNSPSINSVIQTIIDRANWTSGNAIVLYVEDNASGTSANNYRQFYQFNQSASIAPKLHIEYSSGGPPTNYFDGLIDEVRLYNRALSPNEVQQLYNWAPEPVGWWKLDENTGTTANDSSGNDNSATLTNSPSWTVGKYSSGVLFSGVNQHITRADDADFDFADDANMTITTWFKHGTASSQEVILSKYQEAGYKIIMESDGDITCGMDYDSTWTPTDSITSTAANYDDNNWHHIACVKTGATSLELYIDGVLIGSDTSITATNTLTNSDPIYFGIDADGTSNDFTGSLDDIKIYNYARTQKQITEDMNAGHPAPGSPVGSAVARWKLDDGPDRNFGSVAQDSSGNSKERLYASSSVPTVVAGKIGQAYDFESSSSQYFSNAGIFTSTQQNAFVDQTHIASAVPNTNYGTNVTNNTRTGLQHTLLRFLEVSRIPSSATATSATLSMWIATTSTALSYGIYSLTNAVRNWTENGATWNNYDGTNAWPGSAGGKTSGTDYEADASAPTITNATTIGVESQASLTSGANLTATRISGWFGDNNTNYGLIIGPSGSTTIRTWYSDDTTAGSGYIPKLVIGFTDNTDALKLTGSLSISAWIKPESVTADTQFDIAGKWDGANESYLLSQYGDEIRMYIDAAANYVTTNAINLQTGNWYHIAGVYDAGTSTVTIYVNGKVAAGTISGTIPASVGSDTGRFHIGAEDSSSSAVNFYDGIIDEVNVYSSALTTSQVAIDMNAKSSVTAGNVYGTTDEKGFSLTDPALYLRFNEDNETMRSFKDDSVNNNVGYYRKDTVDQALVFPSVGGIPSYAHGLGGKSYYLPNADLNFGIVKSSASITNIFDSGGTLSFWYKNYDDGARKIIEKNESTVIWEVQQLDATELRFGYAFSGDNGVWDLGITTPYRSKSWNHVLINYNSDSYNNDPVAYVNGYKVGITEVTAPSSTRDSDSGDLNIGGYLALSSSYFLGEIDELMLFTTQLNTAQAAYLYNDGRPRVLYRMDDCTGTSLNDASGNGYTATIYPVSNGNTSAGTCSSGTATDMWNNGTSGKFNSALDFDGSDDYAATGNTTVFADASGTTTNISWGAWVKPATSTASDTILMKGDGGTNNEFRLSTNSSGYPQCEIYASGWQTSAISTTALPTSTWSQVVCTYDGTDIKLYVNGKFSDSEAETGSVTSASTPISLGRDPNNGSPTGYFDGLIDEVKVWIYDLTSAQVQTDFNGGSVRFSQP